ncbi:MAG: hypothetical protein IID09_06330 [Candidatus Hydrogenedentes bacterium]|nr:hypothetical protein [Candidatus Hydrogenedentota bacterium]
MGKIVRYEFLGNPMRFWFMCITVIGIPMAILYLIEATVGIQESLDNPEEFLEKYRSGKFKR